MAPRWPETAPPTCSAPRQGDGTWLMDVEGEPVAPGWLWLDAASITEALRGDAPVGGMTGWPFHGGDERRSEQ